MAGIEAMEKVNVRELPFEDKVEYYQGILADYDNTNEVDILNIFRLVNSYNIFDDKFFDGKESYVTSISEFIDLKMELADEIQTFSAEVVKWYLSLLASCDVREEESDNNSELPATIAGFMVNASIPVMSALMTSSDLSDIDLNNLYQVKGAFLLIHQLFKMHKFTVQFLTDLR